MAQLAALADEDVVKVDANVDGLVKNLNDLPEVGEEKEKVNAAYGAVLKLIKLPLEAWRQYELKKLMVESDPDIQVLTRVLYKETKLTANDIKAEGVEVNNWIRRMSYRDSAKSFMALLM